MTAFDAYDIICNHLGYHPQVSTAYEYEHVFCFRMRQSERLCVVKSTGDVIWEDDLPDELAPEGAGRFIVIGKGW